MLLLAASRGRGDLDPNGDRLGAYNTHNATNGHLGASFQAISCLRRDCWATAVTPV